MQPRFTIQWKLQHLYPKSTESIKSLTSLILSFHTVLASPYSPFRAAPLSCSQHDLLAPNSMFRDVILPPSSQIFIIIQRKSTSPILLTCFTQFPKSFLSSLLRFHPRNGSSLYRLQRNRKTNFSLKSQTRKIRAIRKSTVPKGIPKQQPKENKELMLCDS